MSDSVLISEAVGKVPAAFIVARATGSSVAEAAAAIGKTDRTGRRYMAVPGVREAIDRLRAELTKDALGTLIGNLNAAARRLVKLLDSPLDATALSAARYLLSLGLDYRQLVDLDDRLKAVEDKLLHPAPGARP